MNDIEPFRIYDGIDTFYDRYVNAVNFRFLTFGQVYPLVISHGKYVTEWTLWINARRIVISDCANAETDLDIMSSIPAGNRMESMLQNGH
jgi:hypothetical protein